MDLSVRSAGPYVAEDRSWLASENNIKETQSVTLAVALFTKATHYPNGYIKSGTWIAKATSGPYVGLWGPYDNNASDGRQTNGGVLFNTVPNVREGGPNLGAPLLKRCAVRVSKLPTNHGLDAAGQADLAGFVDFRP